MVGKQLWPFQNSPWRRTIEVNSENYRMYKELKDVKEGPYVVRETLYFLLGDNRHYSEDSRYIGLIPLSKMYGVVE